MAIYVFLGLNGYDLCASEDEAVQVMLSIADGSLSEKELAAWIRKNAEPLSPDSV